MANSRKSKPSSGVDLLGHVGSRLRTVVRRGERLVVGLSGGIDSIVLLDMLARLSKRIGFTLEALHVNHQLSPNAGRWARFCRYLCRGRSVPCRVSKVNVKRGDSTERAAREARYAVFSRARADSIVLAHNADDQAETVLLQLLRGAGVKGLSAMPFLRELNASSDKRHRTILRPLIDVPRASIEAYAADRKLVWMDDESNDAAEYTRNWLRHDILPRIAQRVPSYRDAFTRAAEHFAEASALLDALAAIDADDAAGGVIAVERLRALPAARAKNVVRHMIAKRGWALPSSVRLNEALRQALSAKKDATVSVQLGECELRRYAGAIHIVRTRKPPASGSASITWRGEREVCLSESGILTMRRERGTGLSAARMDGSIVTIRRRKGGEKLRTDPDRPRRTLKNLLQECGVPSWQRAHLPLIYCGEVLACVPGIGIEHAFRASAGEPSIVPVWTP